MHEGGERSPSEERTQGMRPNPGMRIDEWIIEGALRATLYVHDEIHTAAAKVAAPAAPLAAAPAADPWIHIFYYEPYLL